MGVRGESDGVRTTVKASTPVHNKWSQVLIADTERTELLTLITDSIVRNLSKYGNNSCFNKIRKGCV